MAVVEDLEYVLLTKRKLELSKRLLNSAKQFGLAFYRPSVKQDSFHRAGVTCKRRMVRAGNRFGKSTCGVAEDCAWLLHERPWYPENDAARKGGIPQHPIKLLTITTDWDKVDEIFTGQRGEGGKVWKYLPTGALAEGHPCRKNHSGVIDTIELRDGSLWRFDTVKAFMSNPQGSESSDWDAIHIDEPCPKDMWKAAARGLVDRGGSQWFTLTPLTEFWINDEFFPEDTGGKIRDDVWAIQAGMDDNPYLSEEGKKDYLKTLSEGELECRRDGLPLHLSGLIYKQFSWDKHVLKKVPSGWASYEQPPRDYSYYYNVDPHPQTPHAVLFCAVAPNGHRFYFTDLFRHCSVAVLCGNVLEKLDGRRTIEARIDPLAYINDPITETNMAEEFWRCGCYVEKATKALAQGILRVQGELGKEPSPVSFTPACARTLWEMQRYCWDEKENKPIDKDDHMMENLYRMELQDMRYVEPTEDRNPVDELVIDRADMNLRDLEYA